MCTIRTIRCNHQHTTLPPSSLRPPMPASHGLARQLPDPLAQAEAVRAPPPGPLHAHHPLRAAAPGLPMAVRAGVRAGVGAHAAPDTRRRRDKAGPSTAGPCELVDVSGAIPVLVPLLRSTDPVAQENAVTALLNLSLEERNRSAITAAGTIKPLVYALRTGTASAKQNASCALLSLSGIEENRATIGACGAIVPLIALLSVVSTRGKKDALTTLCAGTKNVLSARESSCRSCTSSASATPGRRRRKW
ncbi:hypothetical protein ZWY2020_013411 [Hordeum vulgare]|nr:hypothetical protein ZWY2020_013411 [Hordeum vulgare]